MKAIRAGLGGYTDDPSAALAVLRIKTVGLDSELLHIFRREGDGFTGQSDAGVADAVRKHVHAAGASAIGLQIEAREWRARAELGIGRSNIAGNVAHRYGQIEHAASRQRRVVQHAFTDGLPQRSGLGFDKSCVLRYSYLRFNLPGPPDPV